MNKSIKKKSEPEMEINHELLDIITPLGYEIKANSLIIGENTGKVYGVVRYPQKVDYGWLTELMNISDTVISITYFPLDSEDYIEALSKNITQKRGVAMETTQPLVQQRAQSAAQDGEKLMFQIDKQGVTVGTMMISIMALSDTDNPNKSKKIGREVLDTCRRSKMKGRLLSNLQKEGLKTVAPYYTYNQNVRTVLERIVPLNALMGAFPFASSGFNDGKGYVIGRDANKGLIVVDPWIRGGDRTNSSWVILGDKGTGKSTTLKSIATDEFARGTKLIFIDPEDEMREMTEELGGEVINAGLSLGKGKDGRINPFQIRPVPKDADEEKEKCFEDNRNGVGALALHLKTIEIFLDLYLDEINAVEKALLKKTLICLYQNFSISWDTDVTQLKNEDFPIAEDLQKLLYKKADEEPEYEKEYKKLALLFEDMAHGSDGFMWNGHTTLDPKTQCICLNTNSLQKTSDKTKRTQYFNLLTWCWEQMTKDRKERVLLFADEFYLMLDPSMPEPLMYIRNMAKRDRKYEAGMVIISHQIVDFLDPKIKLYAQPLLDMACYKLLFGTDGKNLEETKKLFNLTEAEELVLEQKRRGHALLMIGSKRLHIDFKIPKWKFDYIGTAGGR